MTDELITLSNFDEVLGQMYKKGFDDGKKATTWIPVSERLPEEDGLYLVYTEEQPFVCPFEDGEFFIGEVLAWMPLPEPYKEVEE